MLLVVARGPSVRPGDEHGFVVPFIAGDLMNDSGVASRPGYRVRRLVSVADVLDNHIPDLCDSFFATEHFYIIPKGLGEVKNYL